jgi:hypothetical protein
MAKIIALSYKRIRSSKGWKKDFGMEIGRFGGQRGDIRFLDAAVEGGEDNFL